MSRASYQPQPDEMHFRALGFCVAQALILAALCAGLGLAAPVLVGPVLAGGGVAIVPQVWFASRVFRRRRELAQASAGSSIAAAAGKFLLAAAGFAIVFAVLRPNPAWAVFAGYGVMLVVQIAGGWMLLQSTGPRATMGID